MRRAARVDANQSEIFETFRRLGASVADTSKLGHGFPDCVVGYRGVNLLVEIKDGAKKPSARTLTPDEKEFFDTWNGRVVVVESREDAVSLINAMYRGVFRGD